MFYQDVVYRFRRTQHVNVQESVAFRSLAKVVSSQAKFHNRRVPVLIDSTVVQSSALRGRSSSSIINKILASVGALGLFCGISWLPIWIRSAVNPADDGTRNRALRAPLPPTRAVAEHIRQVNAAQPWPLEVHRAVWNSRPVRSPEDIGTRAPLRRGW